MLEAGISLVAVNLPSLWLLFTKMIPEKVAQSLRSVRSLHSLQRSDPSFGTGAGTSNTRLNCKPEASSSIDSGRPNLLPDLAQARFHSQTAGERLSGDLNDRMYESYAMHKVEIQQRREQP